MPDVDRCDQVVEDGSDAILSTHKSTELEALHIKDGTLPDPERTKNPEFECVLQLIENCIDATKWMCMIKYCKGVSEKKTTGVLQLKKMTTEQVINVNGCMTKSKFGSVYDYR